MNEPRDGGPAFPCPVMDFQPETGNQVVREQYYGITVRDYFAGMAMSGMLQREHAFAFLDDDPSSGHTVAATTNNYARAAYNVADAMLLARNPQATPCGECGGSGKVDSGGVTPQMHPIYIACPSCANPQATPAKGEGKP